MLLRAVSLCVAGFCLACLSKNKPDSVVAEARPEVGQADVKPDHVVGSRADGADTNIAGQLDEAAFKKLHELRGDDAPAPRGETIKLVTGNGTPTQAYLSLPEGTTGSVPAVVVIHEWWGLNDHIRHWSDRLAAEGYAALAVDLYDGQVATSPDEAMTLVKAVDPERAQMILAAAHTFVRSDIRIQAPREAVIGWCFGGGWSLRDAIAQPDLDAAVIYYGQPVTEPSQLAVIQADLLGVFANEDRSIPPDAVDAFARAVKAAGASIEIRRYDAAHAFANPSSAHYDMIDAQDAWANVRVFLRQHLKPGT